MWQLMDAPHVAPSRVTQKIFAVLVEWYHHIFLTMSFKLASFFYIYVSSQFWCIVDAMCVDVTAVILPTVWLYLDTRFHAPTYFLGFVLSAFAVADLLAGPQLGRWDCTLCTCTTDLSSWKICKAWEFPAPLSLPIPFFPSLPILPFLPCHEAAP